MQPDIKIVNRVLSGQTEEFRILVERYQSRVYHLAYRILGRHEDAQDAVQDAFVRAYSGLHTYSTDRAFWPWVRRIAVNCCMRRLPREIPSDEVVQMLDDEQPSVDSVELEICRRCQVTEIGEIIRGLPEAYRIAIVLRYQEDLPTAEIADLLGESPVAIRVRLHRALKMLTEKMAVSENEM